MPVAGTSSGPSAGGAGSFIEYGSALFCASNRSSSVWRLPGLVPAVLTGAVWQAVKSEAASRQVAILAIIFVSVDEAEVGALPTFI